jgi:hypothetical protein
MTKPSNLKIEQQRKESRPLKAKACGVPFKIVFKGIQRVNAEMKLRMEQLARAPESRKRRNAPIIHVEV